MIRIVFIASLALVVCTLLYVPSITPAERFIDAIQAENEAHRSLWGEDTANRVMLRLLDMQQAVKQPHLQQASPTPAPNTPEAAVAQQVGAMGTRMFANSYFRSIEALVMLASYRACALVELLPMALIVLIVVMIDGLVVRVVRSREFIPHSAELFSASAIGAIFIGAGVVLSLFLPFSIHPMYPAAALMTMLFVLSRCVSNYHLIR